MTTAEFINLIKQGEGETIEFKQTAKDIARNICAFLNTQGGHLCVGVDDDGNILGVSKTVIQEISNSLQSIVPAPTVKIEQLEIDKKIVVIVSVKPSSFLFSVGNIVYIRLGANNRPLNTQEVIEKAAESLKVFFDELINKEAKESDISKNILNLFLKKRKEIREVAEFKGSQKELEQQLKILQKQKNKYFPTNGGLLFFSKTPQKFIPQSKVALVWFLDDQMEKYKDRKEFIGPLWEVADKIEQYFVENLRIIGGNKVGFKRKEFLEYPIEALREAVINALIHRNYFDPSEVRIFIFPNKISIKNPGAFPPGITPENPEHKPRNIYLSQYMYDLGYIEKYGSGIKKIQKYCAEHPLVNVQYILKPFLTEVVFLKNKIPKLNVTEEKIFYYLTLGEKSSSELAVLIKTSRQYAVKQINKLLNLGLIQKSGQGAGVKYFVK